MQDGSALLNFCDNLKLGIYTFHSAFHKVQIEIDLTIVIFKIMLGFAEAEIVLSVRSS